MLEVNGLSVTIGSTRIVDNVSFSLGGGQWLMIVGPNGAGKSTIINAISQSVAYTGQVLVGGEDAAKMKPVHLAKKLGILSQHHNVGYSFSVEEIVNLGRYSYSPGIFSQKSDDDNDMVEHALELTGLKELRGQSVLTLSGGELQRTFLAQLIAQDPELLILDEPTNHLDLVYQKQVFSLVQDWIEKTGRSVISVVHDLSLARVYGTQAMLMDKGHLVALGETKEVLSRETLKSVYRLDVYEWMQEMLSQWQ